MTVGLIAFALAWKFVSPDAPQVVAMEWKRVLESPMSAPLRREIPTAAVPVLSNINFIEGIERVLWTPGLVVLEGSFDLQKLKDMALADGGSIKAHKKAELLAPSEPDGTHVGLIGPSLVMLGMDSQIRSAIDRSEKAKDWNPGAYDLWIRTPGHEFGVRMLGDTVQLNAKLQYTDEASAKSAVENAAAFGLTGRQTGVQANLTGSFSSSELVKRQWRSAIDTLHTKAERKPENDQRKPGVIRIYGLDEGVKEVPLK